MRNYIIHIAPVDPCIIILACVLLNCPPGVCRDGRRFNGPDTGGVCPQYDLSTPQACPRYHLPRLSHLHLRLVH